MKVFVLQSGNYLVISPSGVVTIVYGSPYQSAGIGLVTKLREIALAIEDAGKATAPLERPWVCENVM